MYKLSQELRVPLYAAVGIMEMIWHHTAQYAPRGDIGRTPDEAIAIAVDWPHRKAAVLINALVKCGWLDRSPDGLVVHDWEEHCDNSVKKWKQREGERKLRMSGQCPPPEDRQSPASREALARGKAEAKEFLKPEKEEIANRAPEVEAPDVLAILEETYVLYQSAGLPVAPKHQDLALQLLISSNSPDKRRLPAYVKRQLDTGRWRTEATTKALLNLLRDGDWDVPIVERTAVAAAAGGRRSARDEQIDRAMEEA